MELRDDKVMVAIAVLAAFLIAANSETSMGLGSLAGSYLYWLIRIAIEVAFFVGVRAAIEKYASETVSKILLFVAAVLISHIPFVLSVTAIDIVLGFPELGLDGAIVLDHSRISAFGLELLYLLDNHVIICLLVSLASRLSSAGESSSNLGKAVGAGTFLSTIEPPLEGTPLWVEAQEHYVRISTDRETRMVLARFSDIVRELEDVDGMQVHRSHWVSNFAIADKEVNKQSVHLVLKSGDRVPVSRSYRNRLKFAQPAL